MLHVEAVGKMCLPVALEKASKLMFSFDEVRFGLDLQKALDGTHDPRRNLHF